MAFSLVANPSRIQTKWEDPAGRINLKNMMGNLLTSLGSGAASLLNLNGSAWGDYIFWDSTTSTWVVGDHNISLGNQAGSVSQGAFAVAVGQQAGQQGQGGQSVAVGYASGQNTQGANSVAVGYLAGENTQGANCISVGKEAGNSAQATEAIAIGNRAGYTNQGTHAIAIGTSAGSTNQAANSIVMNASSSGLPAATSGLYINPIQTVTGTLNPILRYSTTSNEIINDPSPSFTMDSQTFDGTATSLPAGNGKVLIYTGSGSLNIAFNTTPSSALKTLNYVVNRGGNNVNVAIYNGGTAAIAPSYGILFYISDNADVFAISA